MKKWMTNIIEARILKGKYEDQNVLILRIPIIPNDDSIRL